MNTSSWRTSPCEETSVYDVAPRRLDGAGATSHFTSASDGVRLHYLRWSPDDENAWAAVVILHGIASHARWFTETAGYLCRRGVAVYALDRRGSGQSDGPRGHLDRFEDAAHDVVHLMGVVKSEHASAPVFVLASSWAAKLGILLAAAPTSLTGLMLTGPGLFPRVGFTRPQTLRILAQHFVDPTARFQIPLRAEQYTNDQDRVALIKADPLRLLTATAQFFWETARLDRLRHDASARIAIPLLVLQGQSDAMMDVPKTARWFAALGVADRTYRGYPGAAHTLDFEHDRATYQRDILEWLSERSQTPGRGATCLP